MKLFKMSNDFQWPFSKAPNVSASRLSPPPPPGCCVAHSKPQRARTWGGEERQRGAWFFGFRLFWGNSQRYVIYIYIYTFGKEIGFLFSPQKKQVWGSVGMCIYVYISVQSWAFRLDISKSKYLRHDACPTTETTTDLGASQGSLEVIHDGPWD